MSLQTFSPTITEEPIDHKLDSRSRMELSVQHRPLPAARRLFTGTADKGVHDFSECIHLFKILFIQQKACVHDDCNLNESNLMSYCSFYYECPCMDLIVIKLQLPQFVMLAVVYLKNGIAFI